MNSGFAPFPTHSVKCRKLSLKVFLDSTRFIAGGKCQGRLELICASKSLMLGQVSVELAGFEESASCSSSFLSSRIVFQGDRVPPSAAVSGPSRNGYYDALKGTSQFPFSFDLPQDVPGSFQFQSCSCKYFVTGVVQYLYHSRADTLFKAIEANVLESNTTDLESITVSNERTIGYWKTGRVTLEGMVHEPCVCSGSDVFVKVRVDNQSHKTVQGIKLYVMKRLLLNETKPVSQIVNEVTFKDSNFVFDKQTDRTTLVHIQVPPSVFTIQNASMAQIVCKLVVGLSMGPLSKDLTIEIPIHVYHQATFRLPVSPPDPIHGIPIPERKALSHASSSPTHVSYMSSLLRSSKRVLPWSDDEDTDVDSNLSDSQLDQTLTRARPPLPIPPLANMPHQETSYLDFETRSRQWEKDPLSQFDWPRPDHDSHQNQSQNQGRRSLPSPPMHSSPLSSITELPEESETDQAISSIEANYKPLTAPPRTLSPRLQECPLK